MPGLIGVIEALEAIKIILDKGETLVGRLVHFNTLTMEINTLKLRRDPKVLSLTREFCEQGKMVAFICHGGWIAISAKILKGKRATGSRGIKDDLENAGAIWADEPVVVDGNLISSRTPKDLAPFAAAMVGFLDSFQQTRQSNADKAPPKKLPGLKPAMLKGMLR